LIRRYVLFFALAAVIDVAAGALAWHHHVASLDALIETQADAARSFLASAPASVDPMRVIDIIRQPEIEVIYAPRGMPGLPDLPRPLRHDRFGGFAAELAHIRPRLVDAGDVSLILVPSAAGLMKWLLTDVGVCLGVLVAIVVAALITGAALARAAREPLLRTTLALEALAGGDFKPQTIQAGQTPEIARLAKAYNAAAETVSRSIEERRAAAAEFQRFLADAGHELRTPLTIVGGYIDVLAGHAADKDATEQRVIDGMKSQMSRMRAMVEKMLLLSRLESGTASPRAVSVASVISEVAETMHDKYPDRDVSVASDPAAIVFIDEDDLYEALCNLVENALRYAPDSPVELTANVVDGDAAIVVADRGPGIAAEEQPMIFERFYRGKDNADKDGSGLGLAIVRRIVERWAGTIALRSDSSGTRVTIRFPRAEKSA
jgi:two-component system OmpR family sensor kinase